ncbi:DNA primase [Candidatus Phytoplasma oryzae]|uniref:DNA primase n=1 Tax=Candidatus Phytoplasma oryzae TaxID=203274 RepID=A0A139JQR4_9MOLU|nr:DNA primase [Candidatus Phytoplasma oryzae]KXT29327.1 DNA primase [Candidatus Phytoplasma oryzae]RAM57882.1 hypothetical protein DH96_01010 [Candidatus Phytoplasma oryzae]
MNKKLIKEINNQISIVELVTKCGIFLKKTGKNFMGLCPFHVEKTPSFSVSPEKNIALCMSCLNGGAPFKFYQQLKKISIDETIKELSQKFNLKLSFLKVNDYPKNPLYVILKDTCEYYCNSLRSFFRYDIQNSLLKNPKKYQNIDLKKILRMDIQHSLIAYLQERKLNFDLIKEFQLGFAGSHYNSLLKYLLEVKKHNLKDLVKLSLVKKKENSDEYYDFFRNRFILPLTNFKGQIVGFVGRLIEENKKNQTKYLFNSETVLFKKSNLLYRFFEHYKFIKEKEEIILCEGFFDVISLFKIQQKNVIATMGTQITKQQIDLLKSLTNNVLIFFDGDDSGQEASLKISKILNQNSFKVSILFLPHNIDPDQYINFSENYDNFHSFKKNNIKDFIFYNIEKLQECGKDINNIKKEIYNLLKFHNHKNQEYYQKEIYSKYQIYVDLNNYSLNIFSNNNFYLPNPILYIDKKIKNIIKNNVTFHEIDIINDILLNREYIDFIRHDIVQYISNPVIIEIIDKVKEYYDIYASEQEINNGINIENFIKIYNNFLNKIDSYFSIYDLLLDIQQSFFFKKKKRITNQEDLKIFYFQLKINNIYHEIEKIKKERKKIIDKKNFFSQNNNKEKFKELTINIKKKEEEIQNKKKEIEKIKDEIRVYYNMKNIQE